MKISRNAIALILLAACLLLSSSAPAGEYKSSVSATVIKKTSSTSDGAPVKYPAFDRPEVTVLRVEIAPGGETGWHKHPVPVYAYMLSGTIEIEMEDGKAYTFSEGDAIIEVVNTLHNGRNRGAKPAGLVVFYTGGDATPLTIKEEPKPEPAYK